MIQCNLPILNTANYYLKTYLFMLDFDFVYLLCFPDRKKRCTCSYRRFMSLYKNIDSPETLT